jgi:hypothetical protein
MTNQHTDQDPDPLVVLWSRQPGEPWVKLSSRPLSRARLLGHDFDKTSLVNDHKGRLADGRLFPVGVDPNQLDLGPLYPPVPDRPEPTPRPIGELLAVVARKLGMEATKPVGGVYQAHLFAGRILGCIFAEQNQYGGDEVEIAQRLLEALDHPLAGVEDPAEHAMERLGHVLAFDGPDWHLDTIRVVDALWLASLGGRPHWQQRRETP